MCMLSFYPAGIQPLGSELLNGADLNPDGHGYAIVTGDRKLIINKGMDGPDMVYAFLQARKANPDGPALFHSRIATSGLVDITGCHPFKVGQDNRTVLAHNGIMFNPQGDRSDTRIFAEDMLPRMGSLDKAKTRRRVNNFIGRANKVVVLTVNPARRETSYLFNESAGHWAESGAWHSNYDFEGRWWDDEGYLYNTADAGRYGKPKVIRYGKSVFACEVCGAYDAVSLGDGVCEVCNACNDCKMNIMHCMCYVPASAKRDESAYATGDQISSDRGYWEKSANGGWIYTQTNRPLAVAGGWEHNS